MSARVLYLSCPWLRFLLNLRFAEIHFAIQRGFFCINRGANEHLSSNLAFHQGGQAEIAGMSQKASKSCRQSAAAALVLRRIRTVGHFRNVGVERLEPGLGTDTLVRCATMREKCEAAANGSRGSEETSSLLEN